MLEVSTSDLIHHPVQLANKNTLVLGSGADKRQIDAIHLGVTAFGIGFFLSQQGVHGSVFSMNDRRPFDFSTNFTSQKIQLQ